MIKMKLESGKLQPLNEIDAQKLDELFPDGIIRLNSDNCPEVAAEIDRLSKILLEQNKIAYEKLSRYR